MTHLFQLAGPLLEKFVGIVVVVRHAGAEGVDEGEPSVLQTPFDQLDQLPLLTGKSSSDVRGPSRDGKRNRVDGVFNAAERRALGVHPLDAGGRQLAG